MRPSSILTAAGQAYDGASVRGRSDSASIVTPDLTSVARVEWLKELQRYQRDCGCRAGAIGALFALVFAMTWKVVSTTALSLSAAAAALIEIIVIAVIGGVIGKLIGLGRARARFLRATARFFAPQQPDRGGSRTR